MDVAAIMPCRGRAAQTVENVRRLLATAGDVPWQLICMVDRDPAVMGALANADLPVWRMECERPGYWYALQQATAYWRNDFTHVINLANDLWAEPHWLEYGVAAYGARFGSSDSDYGLLGFSGDGHGIGHSCHFLIDLDLLTYLGGWPVWYNHNFGDTELCQRTQHYGLYGKATKAVLEHRHWTRGVAVDDAVYQAGRATYAQDEALFVERRRLGWPPVSQ